MFHQVLTSEFDDFLLVRLRAGGDNVVDELLLLFCCSEVDKPDERLQYVHFLQFGQSAKTLSVIVEKSTSESNV
ncbi:MAG: hypothetical protein LBD75_04070 [Candidatus Peribacteria bacterium]|jgi:hypothetical protein|nr:hypothetical protein [Candidatus Peribacteria bacterium]